VDRVVIPFSDQVRRLMTIPGVGKRTAEVVIAEIGADMGQFPTAAHLASWTGLCPGHHESAGKSKSGRARKGRDFPVRGHIDGNALWEGGHDRRQNVRRAGPRPAPGVGRRRRKPAVASALASQAVAAAAVCWWRERTW
jgi:transposase